MFKTFTNTIALFVLSFLFAIHAHAQCNGTLSVLNIKSDSVTLVWTTGTGNGNYEYLVQTASAGQPASGTPTTLTGIKVGGLTVGTSYKAWLRTNCGTSFSNWDSASFTTACGKSSTISVSNITDTSATIAWSNVGGTTTYEYAVDQSYTPPASGTGIGVNTTPANGLSAHTKYYVHVRTDCGTGVFSGWILDSFTTLFPVSVHNVFGNSPAVSIYPNPTHDELHIELQGNTNLPATLTNMMGTVVAHAVLTKGVNTIPLSGLPAGYYILHYTDNVHAYNARILKE